MKSRPSKVCLFITKARCSKQSSIEFKVIHGLYKISYQPSLQHKETMAMYLSCHQLFHFPLVPQSSSDVSNVSEVDSTPLGKSLPTVL